MDLKSKGRTWVGNIYHKFEAICQEVDDFVNKDTIKYVENQVQTVGDSVKKICSNAVHDFHPHLEDDKPPKAQVGARTQNDVIGTNFGSIVGFKEKHRHVIEKKSSKEQDGVDLKGCDPNEADHLGQFSPPPSADSGQLVEKDSHWEETSDAAIHSNMELEMGAEENAKVKEHPASELASSLEGKNSWELLWTQEEHPVGLEDTLRSSADEDHKIADLEKCSPETLVPDAVLRVVPVERVAAGNAQAADAAVINLSLQHHDCIEFIKRGMGLEANVRNEHLVVDNRSYPSYESSSDLSLHSRKKHPDAEESNLLQDKSVFESLPISTNEDYWSTIPAKLPLATSVSDEMLRPFQHEEGECNRPHCSNETETDLSLDGYCSCMSSDFSFYENSLENHASPEYLRFPEYKIPCESYLCSRKFHVETDELSSLSTSGLSLIYRTEDHRNTISTTMSPAISVKEAGLSTSQKDETTCNNLSDDLSTDLLSELVSSGISWEHKLAETEASSSFASTELLDLAEFSHGNSTKKTEEICCDYTDTGGCGSTFSSSSCASLSGLTSSNKHVNLIPAFQRTASSADFSSTDESMLNSFKNKHQQSFEGIVDDSVSDISDADMETIDLSDKAKLEEGCVIVDNQLLYAASCRPRKFSSYKKLIQEAFASRKRLIKEYEQLSIWYGDIDLDASFHSDQCLSPHMTSSSRPSQARDLGESEWELL